MKGAARIAALCGFLLFLTAWTWWGQEKETKASPQPDQKTAAVQKSQTSPKAKASPQKQTPQKEVKETKFLGPKKLSAMEMLESETVTPKPTEPVQIERTPQTASNLPETKPEVSRETPRVPVQEEAKRMRQINQNRDKEFRRQQVTVQEAAKRARTYNQMLTQMQKVKPVRTPQAAAPRPLDQEKIRMIHQEVRRLNPAAPIQAAVPKKPVVPQPIPKPAVKAAASVSPVPAETQAVAAPKMETVPKS